MAAARRDEMQRKAMALLSSESVVERSIEVALVKRQNKACKPAAPNVTLP